MTNTMEFTNRAEVIEALARDFGKNPASFNNNERTKSREKFWTFNRLIHYYWDIKYGRKETYHTTQGEDGYFHLDPSKL